MHLQFDLLLSVSFTCLFFIITANVFGLCVRAGFGAQNCQLALNLNRSTKLQVRMSARLTQNPCYAVVFLFYHSSNIIKSKSFSFKVCSYSLISLNASSTMFLLSYQMSSAG